MFRERKRTAELIVRLRNEELAAGFEGGLFFDSKDEETLVAKDVTRDGGRSTIHKHEDHYVLLEEPEGRYICHFAARSPEDGSEEKKAELVAKQILEELRDRGVDTDKITTLGGDGCPLNTGCRAGIMIWLEKELGWRLNWIICWIHTLELGPRAVISDLDGGTSSGTAFRGPIGALLPRVEKLERNHHFVAVTIGEDIGDLPEEVVNELSTDFLHLLWLLKSIRRRVIHEKLLDVTLGKLSHARWYTTVNRICLLYISKHDDLLDDESKEVLKLIIEYIVALYAPMSFLIKQHNHWMEAPFLFLELVKKLRLLHPRLQLVLRPVYQRGAYCLHPEYLLQAMLFSADPELRKCAVRIIIAIRTGNADPSIGDRSFNSRHQGERHNPPINWQATSLKDIIDLERMMDGHEMLEPPLTCSIPTEDLQRFEKERMEVPRFPLHTQAVERMIKRLSSLSTEVGIIHTILYVHFSLLRWKSFHISHFLTIISLQVSDPKDRDGNVLAQAFISQALPKNNSKKDLLKLTNAMQLFQQQ